jgi:hypothetical protein
MTPRINTFQRGAGSSEQFPEGSRLPSASQEELGPADRVAVIRARLRVLDGIVKRHGLEKARFTPQGLQRWMKESAGGERKRST